MSFPKGTEMFQFPAFAPLNLCIQLTDNPCGLGFPIRKSAGQRVLAPHRSLSQRATSFIACVCQGIPQMPLL